MKMNFNLAALAALGLFALTPAAHAQLRLDGGFENVNFNGATSRYNGGGGGTFTPGATSSLGDGWYVTQGAIDVATAAGFGGGSPHSGSYFAYLDDGYTASTLSQTLATTPGQDYTVSFYLADSRPNPVLVEFGSQTLLSGFAPTNGTTLASQYALYSYTATATSASTILSFTGQYTRGNGGDGTFLDDVSVTAIVPAATPEPGSVALLVGLTTVGAGVLRRKRRK